MEPTNVYLVFIYIIYVTAGINMNVHRDREKVFPFSNFFIHETLLYFIFR